MGSAGSLALTEPKSSRPAAFGRREVRSTAGGPGLLSHRAFSWELASEPGQAVTSQLNPDLSPG